MSFLNAAIIGGVAAVGSAAIGADASRRAANTQADAARAANDTQLAMYNQNRDDLSPWRQGGQTALADLMRYLGVGDGGFDPNAPGVRPFSMADFQADPGYQFRQREGLSGILNRRSALGGLNSGNTLKELMQYGQDLASTEYGNAYNRYRADQQWPYTALSGLANSGQNAAGMTANLGANAANQIGQNQIGAGNAQAAGQVGQANAYGGALSNIGNNWLLANVLQQGGMMGSPGRMAGYGYDPWTTQPPYSGYGPM